jgi:hypothetical protein
MLDRLRSRRSRARGDPAKSIAMHIGKLRAILIGIRSRFALITRTA